MRPDPRFVGLPREFWANVRSISQTAGYTERGSGQIKAYDLGGVVRATEAAGLLTTHLLDDGRPTVLAERLVQYFAYRADILYGHVRPSLMDVDEARALFTSLRQQLNPRCPLPLNKQKGAKAGPALLTGIVNMLVEANAAGYGVDYDPRALTTITRDGAPLRTLARRVDGAFTSTVNPIAIWEIKEYYYTTTFGSRVADGVYETMLDGMELEELAEHEHIDVEHLLIVDSRYTWWECGRSYLCRMVDMLHMGYVDEVLFGREVVERLPGIVRRWASAAQIRGMGASP